MGVRLSHCTLDTDPRSISISPPTPSFDPDRLALDVPYLLETERVQVVRLNFDVPCPLAGTKAAVLQKRADVKDYLDIDALLQNGIALPKLLAAGTVVYGRKFNPLITLKALSYFEDLPALPQDVRARLMTAVAAVDVSKLQPGY